MCHGAAPPLLCLSDNISEEVAPPSNKEQESERQWPETAIGDAQSNEKGKAFPHEGSPIMQEGPREAVPSTSLEFCQPDSIKSPEIPGLTPWLSLLRAGIRLESSQISGGLHEAVVLRHVGRVSSDTLLCFHQEQKCLFAPVEEVSAFPLHLKAILLFQPKASELGGCEETHLVGLRSCLSNMK